MLFRRANFPFVRAAVALAFLTTIVGCSAPTVPSPPPPPSCTYSLNNASLADLPVGGTTVDVTVTAGTGCAWTASSGSSFVEIASGSSGTGNGTVQVRVAPNSGAARVGTFIVAGETRTLSQAGQPGTPPPPPPTQNCTFTATAVTNSFDSPGGSTTVSVRVTSGSGCAWTAVSNHSFITVSPSSGTDAGQAAIQVAPNGGAVRTGTVTIAGVTLSITQGAGAACVTAVSPATQSIAATGGTGTVNVTAPANCAWAPSSNDSFIDVAGGARVGDGNFTFTVGKNPTSTPRSGSMSVGSRTAGVTQPGSVEPALVFSYTGERGDWPSQGGSGRLVYTSASKFTATIDASRRSLSVRMPFEDGGWSVELGAPGGGVLSTGVYTNTLRYPFHGSSPGMSIGGNSRGCGDSAGRFFIAELVVSNDVIQRLHVVMEQHCDHRSPALNADLWIDAGGSTSVTPASLPAAPPTPTSFLTMTSDVGERILGGQSRSYTIRNAVFWPATDTWQLRVGVDGDDKEWFYLEFSAPGPTRPTVGTYENVAGRTSASNASLSVSGNGAGCGLGTLNKFRILEVAYGPGPPNGGDKILRLHVTFEQHCYGTPPALRGELRIVADPWR